MCTGIRLHAKDQSVIYGRTLEFGYQLDSAILMIPRNYCFEGKMAHSQKGFLWTSKYAFIGVNMMGEHELVDGVNEKGLAAGLFYFPAYAEYQEIADGEYSNVIAPWQMASLVLSLCATVDEAKKIMQTIKVAPVYYNDLLGIPPLHMIVHDASGKSIIIEYIKGVLQVFDNPLGVITNSPDFGWHIQNLNNYVHVLGQTSPRKDLGSLKIHPFGAGAGTLGLPGDFTPPSRFVRAAFLSSFVEQKETADQTKDLAFHILNSFDIPVGVVCTQDQQGGTMYGYTQWTSVCDLAHKKYYWHTYANRKVCSVDLMSLDLEKAEPIEFLMDYDAD